MTLYHIQEYIQRCVKRQTWAGKCRYFVFTEESLLCLQHHDDRNHVWRHHGEHRCKNVVDFVILAHHPGLLYEVQLDTRVGHFLFTLTAL